ncbi:hypothetical protein N0V90_003854 [Kalmusia sp. IMI 367209]|nr:hypothetical protein N0V90_003854 [Kalmusia sp. IMI 367209]
MCKYFKKLHPCGHLSRELVDRCLDACSTNSMCIVPTPTDEEFRVHARKSYITCYDCIANDAYIERDAAAAAAAEIEHDPIKQREIAGQRARFAHKQAKLEMNRRLAEENMRAERCEDRRKEEAKKAEEERAKKEGGLWVDVGSARKKGRRGGGAPRSAPPKPMGGGSMGTGDCKEGGGETPKSATDGNSSSRAGPWGKGSIVAPKKILTKADNQQNGWGWK